MNRRSLSIKDNAMPARLFRVMLTLSALAAFVMAAGAGKKWG